MREMWFEKGVGERVNLSSKVICGEEKRCRLEIYKGLLISSKASSELETIFLPGTRCHGCVIFSQFRLRSEVD